MMPSLSLVLAVLFAIANSQRLVVKQVSCDFNDESVCYYTQGGHNYIALEDPPWSFQNYSSARDDAIDISPGSFFISTSALYLLSPNGINLNGNYCLTLDYQMSEGSLNIMAKTPREDTYALFSLTREKEFISGWQHYVRNLDFRDSTYQISISVTKSVAIDNLLLTSGECELPEPEERFCDFDTVDGSRRNLAQEANYFGCDWLTPINSGYGTCKVTTVYNGDHSTRSSSGGSLRITQQYWDNNDIPKLVFSMSPQEGAHCFEFWTYGPQAFTVSEVAVNTNITNVL